MSFLSRFFGGRTKTYARLATVDRPFIIRDPTIGFLNLLGEAGAPLLEADKLAVGPLFNRTALQQNLWARSMHGSFWIQGFSVRQ
jgi:hypothetical protein